MLDDLKDCRGAKVASECVDNKATLRRVKPYAGAAGALLALLAIVWAFRKRRAATTAIWLTFGALLLPTSGHAIAPRHLEAQWTWLSDAQQVQILVAAVLWLVVAAFFFESRRSSLTRGEISNG